MLFFIAVLTLLHWTLGLTVLVGGLALLALTLAADRLTRAPTSIMTRQANLRIAVAETTRRHAEVLKAMAMGPQLQRQWTERSRAFLTAQQDMTDTASTLSSASKVLRMLLQSLVLTAGALLVIEGKRSEEHTSELQSLMRNSYAVFCLKKKISKTQNKQTVNEQLI